MEDYRAAMATSGRQGNLSIKWASVAEKSSHSAYLHGCDGYYPQAHFQQPLSAGPLASYDSDDKDFSEKDIDPEIEARMAQLPPRRSPPRTVSQRMLQSLQQQRGLESRISKSFLSGRDSGPGLSAVHGGQDVSVMYSGRRTYPAESLRKTGHARLSDNMTKATPQETRMKEILEKERANRVFRPQMSCPEVFSRTKKDNGVRFHFRRGTSMDNEALDRRMSRLTLTDRRVESSPPQTALVRTQPLKRVTDPEYTILAAQLADIEFSSRNSDQDYRWSRMLRLKQ
ncbi:hypothetical protein PHMEG_00034513 [Phytophthora megakarya]|uniref:Uncharacterized protein n=1 Tax=Phytophthora megakarya TaxID=4795 RepID=A0A225UQV2_9STRA|nr:hypothetical protein PHMEG_00034513 [Phytophthora megakarya]